MTLGNASVATCQSFDAFQTTTALWGKSDKVVRRLNQDGSGFVPGATQLKLATKGPIVLELFDHGSPHGYSGRCLRISENIHAMLGAR